MALNLFDAARKEAPKAAPKSKGKEKIEKQINGLAQLAQIQVAKAALEALEETLTAGVKDQMHTFFVVQGEGQGRKPDSFRGVDGVASASCELRKRSSRSVLSDEDVALLEKAGIPYDTEIDQKEAFLINPAYAGDTALLAKVSEALADVPGLPADFIQHQVEKSRRVASDASVDAVFQKKVADVLLPVVTVLALKVTTENNDIKEALKTIESLISAQR